ncbi:uncharacterized protein Dwil_GK17182 [Drosophila willistoni]|uniref:RRM domain-containing protein n=1 Tax=Drosophila willistoni TaxID=7260 RepID=B4MKQ8_DROWI|nr:uncharacterized protein Dwil_GK17182 [Drosophila willistoni]
METGQSYKTTQSHGTILVETCKTLDEYRINSLRSGEGELFLKGIHSLCTPEKIMEVATHFGEIFQMRYKIDYYGRGRGFAYLQYIDITSSALALNSLSNRFLQNGLNVTVRVSKNIRELSLHGINTLAPQEVYQQLQKLFEFEKLTIYGYSPDCYQYNIRFENNAAACLAHLSLRTHIATDAASASAPRRYVAASFS